MKEKLDVAQRLQPGAESRLRTAHPLGDRAESAPVERVEVKDPVGLAESERPEDDGLGLDNARRHLSSVISRPERHRDMSSRGRRPARVRACRFNQDVVPLVGTRCPVAVSGAGIERMNPPGVRAAAVFEGPTRVGERRPGVGT
jgi:hypothetical protein